MIAFIRTYKITTIQLNIGKNNFKYTHFSENLDLFQTKCYVISNDKNK